MGAEYRFKWLYLLLLREVRMGAGMSPRKWLPGSWFRMPRVVLTGGQLALMSGAEAKVYTALCSYVNEEGDTWQSLTKVAVATGLDVRTVRRAVRKLQEKGHLFSLGR